MAGLSASIRILLGKIESAVNSDFAAQHKKSALLLDMLRPRLSTILPLVPDLEEKQLRDQSMKVWIQKLADVVYDADDLVDEILYDDARIKVEAKSKKAASFARKLFFSLGKRYGKELKSNIKRISELTDYLLNVKNNFNLLPQRKYEESQLSSRSATATTSLVDEAEVVGRDEDMQKIVNLLVTGDADLDVIAIVGMGGIGKTTLAQVVYNSTKVNRYFDLKIWICVSDDFDVPNITRQILESTTAHVAESHNLTLNLLQTRLRESLKGKRFLLVLDDVWNENFQDWEAIKAPLIYGAKGSRILITTRIHSVAGVMRSSNRYDLDLLPDDECWDIFHRIALADMSQNVQLEHIGKELVKRCSGLPLAVRAMGGLLRTKRTPEVWHQVLKSDIFQTVEDSMVLPVLHLSYFHLPDHLKPCFAYCSLFPSDYKFEAEKLILLWIAEGFVVHSGNLSMEEVGAEYFNGLLERSFFQSTGGSYFKMHDLIHDLASYVAGEGFPGRHNNRTRHLSLSTGQYDASEKLQGIHEAKSLRTFLNHGSCQLSPGALEDMLARQRRLRVLSLPQFQNAQLPHSIGKLKHLSQLDLTGSALICLPESLCTLYYLQTLVLTNCVKLVLLPEGIVVLINLRHLFINGTGLQQMPKEIGRMKQLQTLTDFIVGYELNIKELGALIDLHGSLFVSNLQNVSSASDASEANLKDKIHLNELQLEWSSNQRDPVKHMVILENLEPSKALRKLTIQFYGGTNFPFWLGDSSFSNIVFLCLRDCNNCCSVPPLGELPSLEDLIIERIVAVTSIGHEFYRRNGSIARTYQSLKTLTFEGMTEWEQWISLDDGEFPHLRKLHLTNCPKLEWGLPKSLPSLVELRISDCQQLSALLPRTPDNCKVELHNCDKLQQRSNDDNLSRVTDVNEACHFPSSVSEISGYQPDSFLSSIPTNEVLQDDSLSSSSSVTFKVSSITKLMDLPPQLCSLKIERCNTLESLPRGILDRPLLQRLYIIDLDSLKTFPQLDQPSSLKKLYISNCRNFEFPQHNEVANQFIQLEHLCLGNSCDSLMSFPLNAFPKLTTLTLWDCKNLESLSMAKGLQNDMKSLEVLEIRDCTKFITFPTEGLQAPHLTSLVLSNCNNLKSLPRWMQSLISLQSLHINKCSKLERLPPWQLPSSLNILCISLCDKITPQTTWELSNLPSLGHFEIEGGCQDVFLFPEDGLLPNNLKSLRISSLLNLKSLDIDGIQQLTSLQSLEIIDCKELRSLPEDGLPSSLQHLSIMGCSLLNPKLQKRKGKEWFKISHIPSIQLGDPEVGDYGRDDLEIWTVNYSSHKIKRHT